ncbi:translation initiation factor IF-2 [Candidatus Neomarinimicrobiota bacterium]
MANRPLRIFQIAKELNISHTEILSFLKINGIDIASHMSPVDENTHQLILAEFAKDKANIDRYRKDQVRREIQDTRIQERQTTGKKLKLLSLDDQRLLEQQEDQKAKEAEIAKKKKIAEEKEKAETERIKAEERKKEIKTVIAKDKKPIKKAKTISSEQQTKSEEEKKKVSKESEDSKDKSSKKHKLRKITLSHIEPRGSSGAKKDHKTGKEGDSTTAQKTKDRVRQTLAKIDTRKRKKSYKRDRDDIGGPQSSEDLNNVRIAEFSSIDELSNIFNVPSGDIIKTCFGLGMMATINQRLEWDVIELLAEEFGFNAIQETIDGGDLFSFEATEDDIDKAVARAPVVTVMGHVDHGKTSILDYIRNENVVAGESGGITQHIGAYKVATEDGKSITFIDTPGHAAFTAMRARGAQVTDIVVLVVAADDAVMPQTIEAIDHAKAAGAPLVIAINKIDKPGIDIDRVKRQLSDHNVLVEDWGGKVQSIPTSAKSGDGIGDLLAAILLEAEMLELKTNRECLAMGTVIDARLDKGYGPIATVLIQKGTLNIGEPFLCNNYSGKVRAIMNERGKRIKKAFPSDAVQILGFEKVPQAADIFLTVENERELKRIASERQRRRREIEQKKIVAFTLDSMSMLIKEGSMRELPLIIKGDVDGSIDALAETLMKLNTGEVGINVIHKAVGMVSESDVLLAEASKAVIVGFNVQVGSNAKLEAKRSGVDIRSYRIIYKVVEEIKLALEGLLEPDQKEEIIGKAIVLTQFKIPKIGFIAGSKVEEGIIKRNAIARLIRDGEILYNKKAVTSLKRFKDDAKEVKEGLECGIGLEDVKTYNENDIIEVYEIIKVKRTLD